MRVNESARSAIISHLHSDTARERRSPAETSWILHEQSERGWERERMRKTVLRFVLSWMSRKRKKKKKKEKRQRRALNWERERERRRESKERRQQNQSNRRGENEKERREEKIVKAKFKEEREREILCVSRKKCTLLMTLRSGEEVERRKNNKWKFKSF